MKWNFLVYLFDAIFEWKRIAVYERDMRVRLTVHERGRSAKGYRHLTFDSWKEFGSWVHNMIDRHDTSLPRSVVVQDILELMKIDR